MEISGKIVALLPGQSGQGKNGTWKKQEYILETTGQYPKKVCFSIWGDKIDQFAVKQGETVEISFDVESREYNQRWYTELRAFRVTKQGGSTGNDGPPNFPPPADDFMEKADDGDLPF
ncbi:DUF3127 domain-containing protein [Cytophaga aurantiaca]|uniref:DUF3127 domain-containing protein n=1 Tax=Cytophaga aurantiaca TaxID=29530 RepID=UPI00035CB18D|nr:DUF3127 domain-containing protein [Cytophaga aurantiaca]